ncbi:hypothetical protein BX600DRAFT_431686 [Xylariales sp. PMI_506]|nr:hypothetical protein BX600DRAFT_431686 [Xylariales sp. PMI_506]
MNDNSVGHSEFGGSDKTLDPNVQAVLPDGCRVLSIKAHGVSFWGNTGRIDVELSNGSPQSFFIKVSSRELAKQMVYGEFESMKAIYNVLPEFVPAPIAWGMYRSVADTYFFLCEFREMINDMPNPSQFAAQLAALHQSSKSLTGKFGFHVTTYGGNLPQLAMRKELDLEIAAKGYDPEFDTLIPALFDRVIPRLLGPLESDSRSVKPTLVHGDLWYANSGVEIDSNKSLVFDACCFYAHNEYEFGQWRPTCNRFGPEYIAAYNSLVQISYPEEDYEGGLDLYRLRFDTRVSALFTENNILRTQVLDVMRDLVQGYG